jgi:hypothetical protein
LAVAPVGSVLPFVDLPEEAADLEAVPEGAVEGAVVVGAVDFWALPPVGTLEGGGVAAGAEDDEAPAAF